MPATVSSRTCRGMVGSGALAVTQCEEEVVHVVTREVLAKVTFKEGVCGVPFGAVLVIGSLSFHALIDGTPLASRCHCRHVFHVGGDVLFESWLQVFKNTTLCISVR